MNAATLTAVAIEECPGCGSVDVSAVEGRWFAIELDRDSELRADRGWAEQVEFTCRDCGDLWG